MFAKKMSELPMMLDPQINEDVRYIGEQYEAISKDETLSEEERAAALQKAFDALDDKAKQQKAEELAMEQRSIFTKIGQQIENQSEKISNFASSALKTGGFLAGLTALVLGVIDPEQLSQTIANLTEGFMEIIEGLVAFFKGDFEGFRQKIGENLPLFSALIAGIGLYFAGPLLSAFGGIFTKLGKVVKAIKLFRVFMTKVFAKGMISGITTIGGMLGAALAPVLIIVAIIGVIVLGFMALKKHLGEGATLMDTMKYGLFLLLDGLGHIVNAFTFIPRKIFEFFGERIGKFLLGDDFEMPSFFKDGMKTNRAATLKAEIAARPKKPKTDKIDAEIKEQQDLENIDPTTMSGEDLEGLQDANIDYKIGAGTGGGTNVVAPTTNAAISSNTSTSTVIQHSTPTIQARHAAALVGR
tara:strand:+ start:896 stop:2134 length:1239 start_codon:yes stop_codon:yes gene_type:complete